jgi:alpha-tubulin suppressor-like RCC1 family protein
MTSVRLARHATAPLVLACLALLVAATPAAEAAGDPAKKPTVASVTATSGPSTGGTRVTVKGSGLSHVTAVTFDGINGTSVKVSSSHAFLQVTTPAHGAGLVHVRVTTSGGMSAVGAKDVFTYRIYTSLTGGRTHTCATASGTVHCWRGNAFGQLGNNSTTDAHAQVVVSGLAHVVAVKAGWFHTCALSGDGTVRCWGYNGHGQLGDGRLTETKVPVKVRSLSNVVAIDAGYDQTCAVIADGTVRCWGDNTYGQLGNNTTTASRAPVKVKGLADAVSIATGSFFTCAVLADGTARCWGRNISGQLGNGTITDSQIPVRVIGVANATAIDAGDLSACALVTGGRVRCWGYGGTGAMGNGLTKDFHSATPVAGVSGATALSVGGGHACALLAESASCWGDNVFGEVGDGSTTSPRLTPGAVAQLDPSIALVAAEAHSCARLTGGALRCWGQNANGELGNNTTKDSPLPVHVSG